MKRLVWFAVGAAAGAAAPVYARRKARQAAERYRPVNVAKGAVDRLTDAVREGRAAMVAKEAELRTSLDASPSAATEVLLVEGVIVPRGPYTGRVDDRYGRPGPRRRSRR
jgi:hypothetical protein